MSSWLSLAGTAVQGVAGLAHGGFMGGIVNYSGNLAGMLVGALCGTPKGISAAAGGTWAAGRLIFTLGSTTFGTASKVTIVAMTLLDNAMLGAYHNLEQRGEEIDKQRSNAMFKAVVLGGITAGCMTFAGCDIPSSLLFSSSVAFETGVFSMINAN